MQDQYNEKYKDYITSYIKESKSNFCSLRKERQMDYLLVALSSELSPLRKLSVLDAGCGYGRLVYFLKECIPNYSITGVDFVPLLIEEAKKLFKNDQNIQFLVRNILDLPQEFPQFFDISIMYKTLPWLPDYEQPIRALIKATKRKIIITALFLQGDYDFFTRVKNHSGLESTCNVYSLSKFEQYCRAQGVCDFKATRMSIDFDLPKDSSNQLPYTYTEKLFDGSFIELCGPLLLNWYLIELSL